MGVAYAIAEDNLKLGGTVIADSVNPIKITREAWRQVAKRAGVKLVDVVVTCQTALNIRAECRPPGTRGSDWAEILNREFDATDGLVFVVDTANRTMGQCLDLLEAALQGRTQ